MPPLLLAAGAWITGHAVLGTVLAVLSIFLISFFRDPERAPAGDEKSIVSPADGTVLSIAPAPESPVGAARRLSIFMSVFNCHVNRSPVTGLLSDYVYSPGKKLAAFDEKASTENEQNRITMEDAGGGRVVFKQIAGLLARRIVFYPRAGDSLARSQRIGIILFGSRVDLFVPDGAEVLVKPGEKVRAGRTELARWP